MTLQLRGSGSQQNDGEKDGKICDIVNDMAEAGGAAKRNIIGHKAAGQMIVHVAGSTAAHEAESQPEEDGALFSAGKKGKNRQKGENTAGENRYEAGMVLQQIHKHSPVSGIAQDHLPAQGTGQVSVLSDFMLDVLIGDKNGQRRDKKCEHVKNLHFKSASIISQEMYG